MQRVGTLRFKTVVSTEDEKTEGVIPETMLEIPFPPQACLMLGPTEAHIKGAAAVRP